jgi:CelD/BcsL family acetyltransferase involved in cellulose biosynthesis
MTGPTMRVRTANPEEWDGLIDRAALGTVYHRDAWLTALEQAIGTPILRLVAENESGPIAAWPTGLIRKGPLRVAGSPLPGWNTAYLGPVFLDGRAADVDTIRTMLRAAPLRNPSFVALRMMDTDLDLGPIGFRATRRFETYEVDLTLGEEALWSGLKSTCRTRIRKGEKNGLEIREETDGSYLDEFYRMAEDVFAKSNQRPPYSRRFLEQIEQRLRPAGELLVTSAFLGDARVATLIIPHDRKTAMYFAGGTHADHLSLAPNNLLHWRTMMTCMERGLHTYDFISNRGSPGKFKSTFSPRERVSCVHWERASNPLVKFARDRFEQRARRQRAARSGGTGESP